MSIIDDDTEEPNLGDQQGSAGASEPKGRRQSFHKVRRYLTEDELKSSGVQKMLLDEIDRLDVNESELKIALINYNDANRALSISQEKLKTHNAFDIISTGGVATGSLLFGAAFSLEGNRILFGVIIIISVIIVAIGIVAKVVRA